MRHASRGPGLGARAAGPHPRRQARSPGDAGQRPALPGARARRASTPGLGPWTRREQGAAVGLAGSAGRRPASAPPGAVPRGCGPAARAPRGLVPGERPPRASVRGRAGNKARCWGSPGARAAGPHPRRQARSPGDAGQRPALPGARARRAGAVPRGCGPAARAPRGSCQANKASTPGLGARTRREQGAMLGLAGSAGRRPASAPPGAVPRGCGPAARAPRGLVPCERPPRASVRGRAGNKARCWGSPGARAAGPHPRRQARSPGDAGQRPALPGARARRASTPGLGARTRREQGAMLGLAGSAGRRPASAPPGAVPRGCGPAARAPRGLVPCERPPRASVRGRAGNKARCWGSPGARAAGPHPRRQARSPGDAGQRPALPGARSLRASTPGLGARTRREQGAMLGLAGSAGRRPASAPPGAVPRGCGPAARAPRGLVPGERPPRASVRGRAGNKARCWGSPGARAAGPHPRRQARSPGDAGQRPALPGGSCQASVHPGPRCADAQGTRRDVGARRERGPPARIRAARRGPPGMRASGPRSQGLVPCERPPRASVRGRAGNKARCWGSPGARAAGPHPRRQARSPGDAGQRPALPGARSLRASTPGLGARTRREQGAAVGLAGSAGRRPASAPPGAVPRGCGPAARAPRGLVPGERPPRASVRGRAGNKARRWGSPGARAAGPHPRRQARCWCSMGARGPRTEPCAGISPTAPPPRRAPPPVPPR